MEKPKTRTSESTFTRQNMTESIAYVHMQTNIHQCRRESMMIIRNVTAMINENGSFHHIHDRVSNTQNKGHHTNTAK